MTFDNWAPKVGEWIMDMHSSKVEDEIRSLFSTSNINLFAANI